LEVIRVTRGRRGADFMMEQYPNQKRPQRACFLIM
jgi:hypothetical protein